MEAGYIARINQLKRELDATTKAWKAPPFDPSDPALAAALVRISRLETALRIVDRWAVYTGTSGITDAGHEVWFRMLSKLATCSRCNGEGFVNEFRLAEDCNWDRCKRCGGTGVEAARAG